MLDGRVVAAIGSGLVADFVLLCVLVVGALDGVVDDLATVRCCFLQHLF